MTRGRPKFGFFIFNCPSDHEIDGLILSESDTVKAVLSNRNLGSRLKCVTCTTVNSFLNIPSHKYAGIRFVHLGGHGSETGLSFIGGFLKWSRVANKLATLFPKLKEGEKRVLTLSCCYSKTGVKAMVAKLNGHFTAAYHFVPQEINFSTAITTWSMFYLKKKLKGPHSAIQDDINKFMDKEIIKFAEI